LDAIIQVNPIFYNYKQNNELNLPSDKSYIGAIAQEIQKVIPEAVTTDDNGYLVVNNDPIIWAMLNAIKELKAENDMLRSEVQSIKNTLNK